MKKNVMKYIFYNLFTYNIFCKYYIFDLQELVSKDNLEELIIINEG